MTYEGSSQLEVVQRRALAMLVAADPWSTSRGGWDGLLSAVVQEGQ